MFLPMPADATNLDPNAMNVPVMVDDVNPQLPPPPPPADPAFVDVNAAPLPPEQLPAPPPPDAPPVDALPPGELPPPPADAPPGSLI